MKKNLMKLFLALCIAAGLTGGLLACSNTNSETTTAEEDVEYYGCPNSLRIRKLNLKKRKVK